VKEKNRGIKGLGDEGMKRRGQGEKKKNGNRVIG